VGASIEWIGSEKVWVNNHAEKAEAESIIAEARQKYGVEISSDTTLRAIRHKFRKAPVPESEWDTMGASPWEMKELRAVRKALSRFAPILGPARNSSSYAHKEQGLTSVGRVNQLPDVDGRGTNKDLYGMAMEDYKSIALYDLMTNDVDKTWGPKGGSDAEINAASIEATVTHEFAHRLMGPMMLDNWVKKLDYWRSKSTKSGHGEKPPTEYGEQNASEDLCESVAMYFDKNKKDTLMSEYPKRYKIVRNEIASWDPPVKEKVRATASGSGGRRR
jgi:hypothetical protein